MTAFFGLLLLTLVLAGAGLALFHPGSGPPSSWCVNQPWLSMSNSNWQPVDVTARPGATLMAVDHLQGCLTHAGIGQWLLYYLMLIPSAVVWAGVIVLLWLMMRTARREGPFTPRVAAAMRRCGGSAGSSSAAASPPRPGDPFQHPRAAVRGAAVPAR